MTRAAAKSTLNPTLETVEENFGAPADRPTRQTAYTAARIVDCLQKVFGFGQRWTQRKVRPSGTPVVATSMDY